MSDKSNEQISNLMDGELEANASKFLLKRMASDDSLSHTWNNYHLIKSCLQKETTEPLVIDVAGRVCKQLSQQQFSQEVPETIRPEVKVNRWLKPIMGIGIAASVAFMSVSLLRNQQVDSELPIIVKNNANIEFSPLIKPIQATIAGGSSTLVPPPSLSRFPSVSAESSGNFNQGLSYNMAAPYIIIINQSANAKIKQLSPIRIQDISD